MKKGERTVKRKGKKVKQIKSGKKWVDVLNGRSKHGT